MAAVVSPEGILKELSALWVSLGKQEDSGVLRACAMTLIMATGEEEDAAEAGLTLAELIHEHPSRAIVLRVVTSAEPVLESRVLAQCWMPFGKRQQICCEQIEITASPATLPGVQRILGALVAPDLPVMLVCRSPRLFGLPKFQKLLAMANKVVADSHGSPEPWGVMQRVADMRANGRDVADLAWTRLTPLRQEIGAAFDEPGAIARLPLISRAVIAHPPGPMPPEALYLTAWLHHSLGRELPVSFQPEAGSDPITRVDLIGEQVLFSFRPPFSRAGCELLREELSISGRDSVYDSVLAGALALA
ncbi:MAG: glucose-6-phosphate dehydrogenase assembly protein OpcA [Bryobacteraceae bacterium]|nr:glucose-6-phosphate dehydrogenase assembly protein OpcA [Bryobacteraceae bacterium]